MKGTVIFVGFGHRDVTFIGEQQVTVIILQYSSQEGIAIYMRLPQQMCSHA